MRVLLVDDEEEFVSTLAERLIIRGIDVQWATTGSEAVELAKAAEFDLAVLDVKMPKLGGLALREMLQTQRPEMKCIFLTGHGSEKDFQEITTRAGEGRCLMKPVDIDELIQKMNSILGTEGDES